jgi:hypothetical protein
VSRAIWAAQEAGGQPGEDGQNRQRFKTGLDDLLETVVNGRHGRQRHRRAAEIQHPAPASRNSGNTRGSKMSSRTIIGKAGRNTALRTYGGYLHFYFPDHPRARQSSYSALRRHLISGRAGRW